MTHIWMSHDTHMNESRHTYEWVMTHIWMSHDTHMNESWHTHEWVMTHIWMSHDTHMNESRHTYEWVLTHIWMSHDTPTWMRHGTHARVISHTCMSDITHMHESRHTYSWDVSHTRMNHVTHMDATYRVIDLSIYLHVCDTMHSCEQHDVSYVWLASFDISGYRPIDPSHMQTSFVTHMTHRHAHMSASCHTHEYVVSHTKNLSSHTFSTLARHRPCIWTSLVTPHTQ